MKLFIDKGKKFKFLWLSLNVLRWTGFLLPDELTEFQKKVRVVYASVMFMFMAGILVIGEIGILIQDWGNVPLMVQTLYLFCTNIVNIIKIVYTIIQKRAIFEIINEGDEDINTENRVEGKAIIDSSVSNTTKLFHFMLIFYSGMVLIWVAREEGELLFRSWYPVDVTKSPAYELAYAYQSLSVMMLAITGSSFDFLVISLISVFRCRLKLLQLSIRTIFDGVASHGTRLITTEENRWVAGRLRLCIIKHQAILESIAQMRTCTSHCILAQFVSAMVVLCFSSHQLSQVQLTNKWRLAFMLSYLLSMTVQTFAYCYQGHHLSDESLKIADAVYETPWYVCSLPIRRSVLLMMVRSGRAAVLTVGGFTTLSLECFMSIIRVSYSFFTVLQQVE